MYKPATALLLGLCAANATQAQLYDLVYHEDDGLVTIEKNSGILSFVLFSDTNAFIPGSFTGFLNAFPESLSYEVSEANGAIPPYTEPVIELGFILPAGLSESEYNNAITSATHTIARGQPIYDFNLVHVPEPTSLALLGVGGVLALRRHRAR